jgi:hypothetical protein
MVACNQRIIVAIIFQSLVLPINEKTEMLFAWLANVGWYGLMPAFKAQVYQVTSKINKKCQDLQPAIRH